MFAGYDAEREVVVALTDRNGISPVAEYAPVYPARYEPFGTGCTGTNGIVRLDAVGRPWVGSTFTVRVTNLPIGMPAFLVTGASDRSFGGTTLPLDLGPAGMTGCALYVSIDVASGLHAPHGSAEASWAIPSHPSLFGVVLHQQAVAFDPGANPAGAITSHAAHLRLGGR